MEFFFSSAYGEYELIGTADTMPERNGTGELQICRIRRTDRMRAIRLKILSSSSAL